MKKIFHFLVTICVLFILFLFFILPHIIYGEEVNENELHSLSACLLDADSGRTLYEKDGYTLRANASTTKILTCIIALEYGNPEDLVTVSKYASSMPDVQLGMMAGEQYKLYDLLYSLMLESHNDTAVAIAEHIGTDVATFSQMMNEKALEIGCTNSHFITPNGLDASETIDGTDYIHGTTASDLCKIMAYCIKNDEFLKITQTASYSFSNYVTGDDGSVAPGSKSYSVNNKNAFLSMMDGVLSGKTGFTGDAGYCYVSALRSGDRTYTIALLGCGWPNNKTYKWADAKLLFNYGLNNFTKKDIYEYGKTLPTIQVNDGISDTLNAAPYLSLNTEESPLIFLLRDCDIVKTEYSLPASLDAPVYEGDVIGNVTYKINDDTVKKYNIYASQTIEKINYFFCFKKILNQFFLKS